VSSRTARAIQRRNPVLKKKKKKKPTKQKRIQRRKFTDVEDKY
jgi:hypothetical protein